MAPKLRFQILLEPNQLAALRRIQARTLAPVSSQIRAAVAQWIVQHEEMKSERKRASTLKRS